MAADNLGAIASFSARSSSDQAARTHLSWALNLSRELENIGRRQPGQRDEEDQRHHVCAHLMPVIVRAGFL